MEVGYAEARIAARLEIAFVRKRGGREQTAPLATFAMRVY
jgi:hypothetical protein